MAARIANHCCCRSFWFTRGVTSNIEQKDSYYLEGTLQSCWGDFLLALWVEAGDLERNNLGDTGGKGYGQDNMVVLRNLIGSVPDDRNLGRTRLPRMLSVRYSTKYPR